MKEALNNEVRQFWEQEPCGSSLNITEGAVKGTTEWYKRIEEHRYDVEPFIHSVAQFTRHCGKKMLEIGVGAGTDHLQWARAGAHCYGVDLTDAAIEATQKHLAIHGFYSQLQVIDAEKLPFDDESFDLVYSWGVIHHSEKPEQIISEIRRVLKQDGIFVGMMYKRYSFVALKLWLKYALLRGKPWRSFSHVIWHRMESIGTKAYTVNELNAMFSAFRSFSAQPLLTTYDTAKLPIHLSKFLPDSWGWFIALEAKK